MERLNEPIPKCKAVESVEEAIEAVEEIGYPVIVRPAFTLGGTGGGVAHNEEELIEITRFPVCAWPLWAGHETAPCTIRGFLQPL